MFEIASEWKLRVTEQRTATDSPIPAIEPDVIFTSNTIGIFAESPSAPSHWYAAGDFLQAYLVGFGSSGYAQGELVKVVLSRYQMYRFTKFPLNEYLISFVPKPYLKDVNLKVWEYVGENQGTTLESLEASVRATHQRVITEGAVIKSLIKKLSK
ncbi:hypothetical protein [Nostoc linckia]|uniref:hypothetical protein n=1 Tax=Nostoc linckia TaxID=92942 RepID=UPI000BFFFA17|nr:hypothetical protein [Nostoc linckia]